MDLEEENTFRVLKNEDPLVTSWFCKFGWHSWTKWQTYKEGTYRSNYEDHPAIEQRRTCVHCNTISGQIIKLKGL